VHEAPAALQLGPTSARQRGARPRAVPRAARTRLSLAPGEIVSAARIERNRAPTRTARRSPTARASARARRRSKPSMRAIGTQCQPGAAAERQTRGSISMRRAPRWAREEHKRGGDSSARARAFRSSRAPRAT
jgi:hypothetical protein